MSPTSDPGRLLANRYQLGRRLGTGGMGDVWAATDERLSRPVAVKVLRSDLTSDAGGPARFVAEARAAARLHHPNVVAVFDAGQDGDEHFMVMEALPGRTLADRLTEGPLSVEETRRVGSDVLAALGAAHGAQLVHRDVKPGNVLEAANGTWKVADFGIAKGFGRAGGDLTATGMVLGTPAYLSPEQLAGKAATPASDIWAAGVMLYESLAGAKPYTAPTPFAMAEVIRTTEPPLLTDVRPDVPPTLAATIHRAMSVEPAGRWADAAAMGAAVAGGAVAAGVTAADTEAPTEAMAADAGAAAVGAGAGAGAAGLAGSAGAAGAQPTEVMSGGTRAASSRPPSSARRWAWVAAAIVVLFLGAAVALALAAGGGGDDPDGPVTTDAPGAPASTPPPSAESPSTPPPSTPPPSTESPATAVPPPPSEPAPSGPSPTSPATSSPTTDAQTDENGGGGNGNPGSGGNGGGGDDGGNGNGGNGNGENGNGGEGGGD